MKYLLSVLFCLFTGAVMLQAQDLVAVEKLLETNAVERSEEGYEDLVQVLLQLQATPLNINTAGFDSLKMLFFLSDSQIDNILTFRKKYGVFLAVEELLLAGGIGKRDLDNIRAFITTGAVSVRERVKAIKRISSQELIAQAKIVLPRQEGYKTYSPRDFKTEEQYRKKLDNRFQGIPLGTQLRYKWKVSRHLQVGLILENDPGEAYFTRNQKMGFDFFSFHVYVNTKRWLRTLAVGDYRIQWGQGLLVWGGFSSGKSSLALGNEKSGRGISPYTSTDENNFLRGVALAFRPFHDLNVELFASYKKTDGNILETDSLTAEDMQTATLYLSGYHRNNNECRKKDVLNERTIGGSVRWNHTFAKVGINALYYDFTPEITVGGKVYRRYNDRGKERFLLSADYKTGWGNLYFFGETAYSNTGGFATVDGLRFSGSSRVALCVLYRRYDKRYTSRYASGFGEYSNTSNEEGVYIGADITPFRNMKINAYYDRFRFFSPRYQAFIPGSGYEVLTEVTYSHAAFVHLFRYKREEKPEDRKSIVLNSVLRQKEEWRYRFTCRFSPRWEARSRIDISLYEKAEVKEKGYMFCQDIVYTSRQQKFKGQLRLAYFDTDSYNSRIYSYENSVLYGYAFPAYFDRGFRTYINLNWKPSGWATLYLKSGFTYYPGRQYIGSSLMKVEDNKLFDLIVQWRIKF